MELITQLETAGLMPDLHLDKNKALDLCTGTGVVSAASERDRTCLWFFPRALHMSSGRQRPPTVLAPCPSLVPLLRLSVLHEVRLGTPCLPFSLPVSF